MLKLILTDLDGTFLNAYGDYNRAHFAKVSQKLAERHIHLAIVTGKQTEAVQDLFSDSLNQIFILGDSATQIKYQGDILYQALINHSLATAFFSNMLTQLQSETMIICTPQGAFILKTTSQDDLPIIKRSYPNLHFVDNYSQVPNSIIKITLYAPLGNTSQLLHQLEQWQKEFYLVASENSWLDITAKNVHKGSTVKHLQTLLNITVDESAAFGDGRNDIEMLTQARYSFAMRNACKELQKQAFFTIGSNEQDAVLTTIDYLLDLM